MQPLSLSQRESLQTAAATYQKQMTVEGLDYLAGRGLNAETVDKYGFGLVSSPMSGHEYLKGRLVIPYIGPRGNIYNIRLRCLEHEDCKAAGHAEKYTSFPGYPNRVYNVRALTEAENSIHITEGELDAVTLEACGFHAIGIPGVDSIPAHLGRMVAGFPNVYSWADGDIAGRKMTTALMKAVPSIRSIMLPEGEDVNSIFALKGPQGILDLLEEW